MNYLHWDKKIVTDFSPQNIADLYDNGYVFTRLGKGEMQQTRSVRINLSRFELNSENRRMLKKNEGLTMEHIDLPLRDYSWQIGKLARDFYEGKFGKNIMSAQKIREILTSADKSNFTTLLKYSLKHDYREVPAGSAEDKTVAYAICYQNSEILRYSYPFYDLNASPKDTGLGMMILAIEYAQNSGKKYIYLGSLQRPADTYKLQFNGLEWFDKESWQTDINAVKEILKQTEI